MSISKFTSNVAAILHKIKSPKSTSTAVNTIVKTIDNNKTQQKLTNSMDALASLGKSQLNMVTTLYPQESVTTKLINESIKEGLTPEQALKGAQEVLAATGRQNIPKSAAESARFFMLNKKSDIEHRMDIEDLLNKLNRSQN